MKPIDFHGLVSLDQTLVDHLRHFLEEKETQVSKTILHVIPLISTEFFAPKPFQEFEGRIKLSDAIESFSIHLHKLNISKSSLSPVYHWETTVSQINHALWEYVEILEGGIIELFQQLREVGFEHWQPDPFEIKDVKIYQEHNDLLGEIMLMNAPSKEVWMSFMLCIQKVSTVGTKTLSKTKIPKVMVWEIISKLFSESLNHSEIKDFFSIYSSSNSETTKHRAIEWLKNPNQLF